MRHSVRTYNDTNLSDNEIKEINDYLAGINETSKLNFQLIVNKEETFTGFKARYGKFQNVRNYIALIGNKKEKNLEELVGYYGEKVVLFATSKGLATCWVGGTYNKNSVKFLLDKGEELVVVIAIGHADEKGHPHKSKSIEELSNVHCEMPLWFKNGMEAVLLAPTAMNQQRFRFEINKNKVKVVSKIGFYTKIDLGIVKLHFELGANSDEWSWE